MALKVRALSVDGMIQCGQKIKQSHFCGSVLFGTRNRNRTCNYPLGGDYYIHLTMQAYLVFRARINLPRLYSLSYYFKKVNKSSGLKNIFYFSFFARGNAEAFFIATRKIVFIVKARFLGNLRYAFCGVGKHCVCNL